MLKISKTKIILASAIFLFLPFFVSADFLGQRVTFNIYPTHDLHGRNEVLAVSVKITDQLYFYVDKGWWQGLTHHERESLGLAFDNLAAEFEKKIYPTLTATFGLEPRPGIDRDERITILIHPMIAEVGGYFNSGDVYSRLQNPRSNQREMIYLNSQHINRPQAKSILAHEFMHLITVNQKDLLRGVTEEIWLNDVRAEYSATLLGHDDIYRGSNLERRVRNFLARPTNSLTEWLDRTEDYGVVNLFAQYLVDHYGVKILVDSLQSNKTGIESINYALTRNNYDKDFSQIFSDWLITLLVNNCDLGNKYCYLNEHLNNLRVTPTLYYLPRTETIMSSYHNATYWAANWHRFIGGGNEFSLEFDGADLVGFEAPYLLCDLKNNCSVGFLVLDAQQRGKIAISQFNLKYSSLTLMPFISSKVSGFNGREMVYSFSWRVTVGDKTAAEKEAELISQLLAQIEQLKRQIAEVRARLGIVPGGSAFCRRFDNNLYFGISNSAQVRCLQQFLKAQGPEIYPERLVTGNFFSLTRQAVIRFQEKYAKEILAPLGLRRGTGHVGPATRAKINQLLNF